MRVFSLFVLASFSIGLCFLTIPGCVSTTIFTFDKTTNHSNLRNHSAGKSWSIQKERKMVRAGESSLRFEVRAEDSWKKWHRSEYRELYSPNIGSEIWYGFSLLVPENFPDNGGTSIIGQWHSHSLVGFPNLALVLIDDKLMVTLSWHKATDTSWLTPEYKRHYSKVSPSVCYSVTNRSFDIVDFEKGKWMDFIFQVNWTTKDNGFVNVWMNQKQLVEYKGPTAYKESLGPYFKFGIYIPWGSFKNPSIPRIIYFDEYRRGKSYAEVNPAQRGGVN